MALELRDHFRANAKPLPAGPAPTHGKIDGGGITPEMRALMESR